MANPSSNHYANEMVSKHKNRELAPVDFFRGFIKGEARGRERLGKTYRNNPPRQISRISIKVTLMRIGQNILKRIRNGISSRHACQQRKYQERVLHLDNFKCNREMTRRKRESFTRNETRSSSKGEKQLNEQREFYVPRNRMRRAGRMTNYSFPANG